MQSRSPLFIKVTGLKCSYRKIFSPLTAIRVGKTEQARPLIRTHRKFHKGFRGTARSLKPGSCEEARHYSLSSREASGYEADSGKFLGTLSCLDRVKTKTWTPLISFSVTSWLIVASKSVLPVQKSLRLV